MSDGVEDVIEQYRVMHENAKRFLGYSIRRHVQDIRALVDLHRPGSLLDYGCGKGYQYLGLRLHERWGGPLPHCYDPAVKGLDVLPEGPFDGVLCIDVLEHVPEDGVPDVLRTLDAMASGFIYLSIALTPSTKTLPDGRDCHLTLKPADEWRQLLAAHVTTTPHVSACLMAYQESGEHERTRVTQWL